MANRFSVWCGPTLVAGLAQRLRTAGFQVTFEGTERVLVLTERSVWELLAACGTSWNLRDVQQLPN